MRSDATSRKVKYDSLVDLLRVAVLRMNMLDRMGATAAGVNIIYKIMALQLKSE